MELLVSPAVLAGGFARWRKTDDKGRLDASFASANRV
ncbi:hypothetical protein SAMN05216337_10425 [Bradyrhizobium brasilense]|uniref:Uncharacterized protein n=1 Tax=Bradyrhizobium brasilense TaxID=1419277 RepID=A0A1G7HHK8_9BRAD|nr:hypothetical protein SAMN05216337_10425 [Bradyrhizobium brasilense]